MLGLITLIFVCLKLTKQINWSWIWVFSPLWIPVAMSVMMVLLSMLVQLFHEVLAYMH